MNQEDPLDARFQALKAKRSSQYGADYGGDERSDPNWWVQQIRDQDKSKELAAASGAQGFTAFGLLPPDWAVRAGTAFAPAADSIGDFAEGLTGSRLGISDLPDGQEIPELTESQMAAMQQAIDYTTRYDESGQERDAFSAENLLYQGTRGTTKAGEYILGARALGVGAAGSSLAGNIAKMAGVGAFEEGFVPELSKGVGSVTGTPEETPFDDERPILSRTMQGAGFGALGAGVGGVLTPRLAARFGPAAGSFAADTVTDATVSAAGEDWSQDPKRSLENVLVNMLTGAPINAGMAAGGSTAKSRLSGEPADGFPMRPEDEPRPHMPPEDQMTSAVLALPKSDSWVPTADEQSLFDRRGPQHPMDVRQKEYEIAASRSKLSSEDVGDPIAEQAMRESEMADKRQEAREFNESIYDLERERAESEQRAMQEEQLAILEEEKARQLEEQKNQDEAMWTAQYATALQSPTLKTKAAILDKLHRVTEPKQTDLHQLRNTVGRIAGLELLKARLEGSEADLPKFFKNAYADVASEVISRAQSAAEQSDNSPSSVISRKVAVDTANALAKRISDEGERVAKQISDMEKLDNPSLLSVFTGQRVMMTKPEDSIADGPIMSGDESGAWPKDKELADLGLQKVEFARHIGLVNVEALGEFLSAEGAPQVVRDLNQIHHERKIDLRKKGGVQKLFNAAMMDPQRIQNFWGLLAGLQGYGQSAMLPSPAAATHLVAGKRNGKEVGIIATMSPGEASALLKLNLGADETVAKEFSAENLADMMSDRINRLPPDDPSRKAFEAELERMKQMRFDYERNNGRDVAAWVARTRDLEHNVESMQERIDGLIFALESAGEYAAAADLALLGGKNAAVTQANYETAFDLASEYLAKKKKETLERHSSEMEGAVRHIFKLSGEVTSLESAIRAKLQDLDFVGSMLDQTIKESDRLAKQASMVSETNALEGNALKASLAEKDAELARMKAELDAAKEELARSVKHRQAVESRQESTADESPPKVKKQKRLEPDDDVEWAEAASEGRVASGALKEVRSLKRLIGARAKSGDAQAQDLLGDIEMVLGAQAASRRGLATDPAARQQFEQAAEAAARLAQNLDAASAKAKGNTMAARLSRAVKALGSAGQAFGNVLKGIHGDTSGANTIQWITAGLINDKTIAMFERMGRSIRKSIAAYPDDPLGVGTSAFDRSSRGLADLIEKFSERSGNPAQWRKAAKMFNLDKVDPIVENLKNDVYWPMVERATQASTDFKHRFADMDESEQVAFWRAADSGDGNRMSPKYRDTLNRYHDFIAECGTIGVRTGALNPDGVANLTRRYVQRMPTRKALKKVSDLEFINSALNESSKTYDEKLARLVKSGRTPVEAAVALELSRAMVKRFANNPHIYKRISLGNLSARLQDNVRSRNERRMDFTTAEAEELGYLTGVVPLMTSIENQGAMAATMSFFESIKKAPEAAHLWKSLDEAMQSLPASHDDRKNTVEINGKTFYRTLGNGNWVLVKGPEYGPFNGTYVHGTLHGTIDMGTPHATHGAMYLLKALGRPLRMGATAYKPGFFMVQNADNFLYGAQVGGSPIRMARDVRGTATELAAYLRSGVMGPALQVLRDAGLIGAGGSTQETLDAIPVSQMEAYQKTGFRDLQARGGKRYLADWWDRTGEMFHQRRESRDRMALNRGPIENAAFVVGDLVNTMVDAFAGLDIAKLSGKSFDKNTALRGFKASGEGMQDLAATQDLFYKLLVARDLLNNGYHGVLSSKLRKVVLGTNTPAGGMPRDELINHMKKWYSYEMAPPIVKILSNLGVGFSFIRWPTTAAHNLFIRGDAMANPLGAASFAYTAAMLKNLAVSVFAASGGTEDEHEDLSLIAADGNEMRADNIAVMPGMEGPNGENIHPTIDFGRVDNMEFLYQSYVNPGSRVDPLHNESSIGRQFRGLMAGDPLLKDMYELTGNSVRTGEPREDQRSGGEIAAGIMTALGVPLASTVLSGLKGSKLESEFERRGDVPYSTTEDRMLSIASGLPIKTVGAKGTRANAVQSDRVNKRRTKIANNENPLLIFGKHLVPPKLPPADASPEELEEYVDRYKAYLEAKTYSDMGVPPPKRD